MEVEGGRFFILPADLLSWHFVLWYRVLCFIMALFCFLMRVDGSHTDCWILQYVCGLFNIMWYLVLKGVSCSYTLGVFFKTVHGDFDWQVRGWMMVCGIQSVSTLEVCRSSWLWTVSPHPPSSWRTTWNQKTNTILEVKECTNISRKD